HRREAASARYDLAESEAAGAVRYVPDGAAARAVLLDIGFARLVLYYRAGRRADMERTLARLVPLVEEAADPRVHLRYHHTVAMLEHRHNRFVPSEEELRHARAALAAAERSTEPHLVARARFGLGFVELWAGELEAAEGSLTAGLAGAEATGDLLLEVRPLTYLGVLARLRGDLEAAERAAARAGVLAQRRPARVRGGGARPGGVGGHRAWAPGGRAARGRARAGALVGELHRLPVPVAGGGAPAGARRGGGRPGGGGGSRPAAHGPGAAAPAGRVRARADRGAGGVAPARAAGRGGGVRAGRGAGAGRGARHGSRRDRARGPARRLNRARGRVPPRITQRRSGRRAPRAQRTRHRLRVLFDPRPALAGQPQDARRLVGPGRPVVAHRQAQRQERARLVVLLGRVAGPQRLRRHLLHGEGAAAGGLEQLHRLAVGDRLRDAHRDHPVTGARVPHSGRRHARHVGGGDERDAPAAAGQVARRAVDVVEAGARREPRLHEGVGPQDGVLERAGAQPLLAGPRRPPQRELELEALRHREGDEHEALHAGRLGGVDQRQVPVRVDRRQRAVGAHDRRGGGDHRLDAAARRGQAGAVAQVALDRLDPGRLQLRDPGRVGGAARQGPDALAVGREEPGHAAAELAGRAYHQDHAATSAPRARQAPAQCTPRYSSESVPVSRSM